jgi:hypothetical protein
LFESFSQTPDKEPTKMCIPTKVINPTMRASSLLTIMARKTANNANQVSKQSTRKLANIRFYSSEKLAQGHGVTAPGGPELASCPVITYFSIITIFTSIVYLNLAHTTSGPPGKCVSK